MRQTPVIFALNSHWLFLVVWFFFLSMWWLSTLLLRLYSPFMMRKSNFIWGVKLSISFGGKQVKKERRKKQRRILCQYSGSFLLDQYREMETETFRHRSFSSDLKQELRTSSWEGSCLLSGSEEGLALPRSSRISRLWQTPPLPAHCALRAPTPGHPLITAAAPPKHPGFHPTVP